DKINERIESGEIIEQKAWEMIKELNSYSEERLNSVALINAEREYTYRQMFRLWDNYAEVFSALGITEANNSRVGLISSNDMESTVTFYALNMMNVSVVMLSPLEDANSERFKMAIKKLGITDILLAERNITERALSSVMKIKNELDIKNVIILDTVIGGLLATEHDIIKANIKYNRLKQFQGVLFMRELLVKYEAYPIAYGSKKQDSAAVVVHTSGTTSGIHKPIPHSDRGMNAAVIRILKHEKFSHLRNRARILLMMEELSASYAMFDMVHLPLAFSGSVVFPCKSIFANKLAFYAIEKYNVNVLIDGIFLVTHNLKRNKDCNLSNVELLICGGTYVTKELYEDAIRCLKERNSQTKILVGYGLSEAGGACIISDPDVEGENSIGYPLEGVKVKLYVEDEDKYYDPAEGPRTGVLFLSSKSVSCGKIGDEVFFENTLIDGEEYLNTYDLVRVDENGCFYYVGRMDKYFINNEGVRFDAGLVETSFSEQKDIEMCGMVPIYDKIIHDTVPVLYIQTKNTNSNDVIIVKNALKNAFIKDNVIEKSNLPYRCMICESLPTNSMGKVDTYKILTEGVEGNCYVVVPKKVKDELVDIDLVYIQKDMGLTPDNPLTFQVIPDELKDDFRMDGNRFGNIGGNNMMQIFMDMMSGMQQFWAQGQMPGMPPHPHMFGQAPQGQAPGMPPMGQMFEMFKNMMPPQGQAPQGQAPQGQAPQMPGMPPFGAQGQMPYGDYSQVPQGQASQMPPMGQMFEMFKNMMPPMGAAPQGQAPGMPSMGQMFEMFKSMMPPQGQAPQGQAPGMPPMGQMFEMFKNIMPPQGQAPQGQTPGQPPHPHMFGQAPKGQAQQGQMPYGDYSQAPHGQAPGMPPMGQMFEIFKNIMPPQGQVPGMPPMGQPPMPGMPPMDPHPHMSGMQPQGPHPHMFGQAPQGQVPGMPTIEQMFEMFKHMMTPQGQAPLAPGMPPMSPHPQMPMIPPMGVAPMGPHPQTPMMPPMGVAPMGPHPQMPMMPPMGPHPQMPVIPPMGPHPQTPMMPQMGMPPMGPHPQTPMMPPMGQPPMPVMPPMGQPPMPGMPPMSPQPQAPETKTTGNESEEGEKITENKDQGKSMEPPNMFAIAEFLRRFFNASPIDYDYKD
ncbi:MAG: AMP-binding protein, partial [Lachnospiraceae bacterium]|nr:AMP-binding protein [Lachnospiraceae bacterium]